MRPDYERVDVAGNRWHVIITKTVIDGHTKYDFVEVAPPDCEVPSHERKVELYDRAFQDAEPKWLAETRQDRAVAELIDRTTVPLAHLTFDDDDFDVDGRVDWQAAADRYEGPYDFDERKPLPKRIAQEMLSLRVDRDTGRKAFVNGVLSEAWEFTLRYGPQPPRNPLGSLQTQIARAYDPRRYPAPDCKHDWKAHCELSSDYGWRGWRCHRCGGEAKTRSSSIKPRPGAVPKDETNISIVVVQSKAKRKPPKLTALDRQWGAWAVTMQWILYEAARDSRPLEWVVFEHADDWQKLPSWAHDAAKHIHEQATPAHGGGGRMNIREAIKKVLNRIRVNSRLKPLSTGKFNAMVPVLALSSTAIGY